MWLGNCLSQPMHLQQPSHSESNTDSWPGQEILRLVYQKSLNEELFLVMLLEMIYSLIKLYWTLHCRTVRYGSEQVSLPSYNWQLTGDEDEKIKCDKCVLLGLARTWCATGSGNILKDFKPEKLPFVFSSEEVPLVNYHVDLGEAVWVIKSFPESRKAKDYRIQCSLSFYNIPSHPCPLWNLSFFILFLWSF